MVNKILETHVTNSFFGNLFVGHNLDIDSILEVFLCLSKDRVVHELEEIFLKIAFRNDLFFSIKVIVLCQP